MRDKAIQKYVEEIEQTSVPTWKHHDLAGDVDQLPGASAAVAEQELILQRAGLFEARCQHHAMAQQRARRR
jgi:hypothetical protein